MVVHRPIRKNVITLYTVEIEKSRDGGPPHTALISVQIKTNKNCYVIPIYNKNTYNDHIIL